MDSSQGNKEFIQNILKYRHGNSLKTDGDKIAVRGLGHTFTLPRLPNEQSYPVTSPDCILPMSPAFPVMTYAIGNTPAAVAYQGSDYRTFVMGFPFESIREETSRNVIMASILRFLTTDYTD